MSMQTFHSTATRHQYEQQYIPLALEQRTHVDTNTAAHHLNRRPQTLRGWHCHGRYPSDDLRPLVLNGRMAWSVAAIKAVMGGAAS